MNTTTSAPEPYLAARSHRQILIIFASLMLGMLLAALDQTILGVALPTIVGELSGLEHLSWVITAYLLTSTTSVPLYGKISDIYGRKLLFQVAIGLFLVGSVLCGTAQGMTELIIFRGIQGLGAGGIMAMAQAIMGDIVSPRERGRYVGYFAGVFVLASIGGPLLGGFFTDQLSWRWIFYINLPLGVLALVVATRVLDLPARHMKQRIDFLGAALIVAATSCLLLATTWGGNEYPWRSTTIVGLFAAAVVLGAAFVLVELKVPEPILPLRLFRNSIFSVSNAMAMVTGMAMFGTIAFLPLYMQVVKDVSATESGLRTVPLMVGVVSMSVISGRLISRTGRYRVFPIVGTASLTVAVFLLSSLGPDTSWWLISVYMLLAGIGMGLLMQVVLLAVQNAVDYRDMGTATAGLTFFRSMGGALGVAVFGAILSNRLGVYLVDFVPESARAGIDPSALRSSPEALRMLPAQVHEGVVRAFSSAIDDLFFWAIPVAGAAFLLSLLLREIPLKQGAPGPSAVIEGVTEAASEDGAVASPSRAQGSANRPEHTPAAKRD